MSPSELRIVADLLREADLALDDRVVHRPLSDLRADLKDYSDRVHRFAALVELMVGPRRPPDEHTL